MKRLRATPLRPWTILTAHVLVKLVFTALTVILMILAGKHYYPVDLAIPFASFVAALILSTLGILSIGFLIASLVPTARFAQPVGSLVLYPMIGLSGLFVPLSSLPPALRFVARLIPLTYAVSLLNGMLKGDVVVGAHRRRARAGGVVRDPDGPGGEGIPLGMNGLRTR